MRSSGSPGVPITSLSDASSLQQGRRSQLHPGPLATFVHHHDMRGLDLYLLALTLATHEPFGVILPAGVWARGLGLRGTGRSAAVSRTWKRLVDLSLITRSRRGRTAAITLLREDGSGSHIPRSAVAAIPTSSYLWRTSTTAGTSRWISPPRPCCSSR